ncbi:MAG: hypothetical protein ACT4O0_00135 [Pseudonocardia sp.]
MASSAVAALATHEVLAHGIGGRADLPLPGELVLQAGGFVVLVSFLAVGLLWRTPRFGADRPGGAGGAGGRRLPGAVQRVADHVGMRLGLRGLAPALLAYLISVAFLGPADPELNPAPRALYVLAWVGVVPASLLLGPVWRVLNPLRALHAGLVAVLRLPATGVRPIPPGLGYWPAAAGLAVFVWLELVPAARAQPAVVGGFLLGYAVLVTAAAVVFGRDWFDRGDPFEVYSTLVAALAPFGRRPDGVLTWRNPLRGLAEVPAGPGLVTVLAVWWGSTVFDGVSGSTFWVNLTQSGPAAAAGAATLGTAVLAGLVAVVALSYRLATGPMAGQLVGTLVPIAAGYTVAHYISLLITEAPVGLAQLVGAQAPVLTPAPMAVAGVQVAAILLGHVAGVAAAHDRVLALHSPLAGSAGRVGSAGRAGSVAIGTAGSSAPGRRLAEQVPLVLLMIVYTMAGLYLLVVA